MAETENTALMPEYLLGRDFMSSVRLYLQHWMWRRQLGHVINPTIPMTGELKVADIACGTGIWLLDLAKEYPSAHLDGFDISAEQFPPSDWLPKNTTLATLDIFKPIPESLRGAYDVVHVGLVVWVVKEDDPLSLLDNLLTLLKPGGYIQWDEADWGGIQLKSPNEQVSHAALNELKSKTQGLLLASNKTTFSWVRHLDENFQERQIAVLDNKYLQITDDIALPWTLMHLMATVEFIQHIDRPAGVAEDWWKLYHRVCGEVRSGASMRMAMVSIVGQKPRKG